MKYVWSEECLVIAKASTSVIVALHSHPTKRQKCKRVFLKYVFNLIGSVQVQLQMQNRIKGKCDEINIKHIYIWLLDCMIERLFGFISGENVWVVLIKKYYKMSSSFYTDDSSFEHMFIITQNV